MTIFFFFSFFLKKIMYIYIYRLRLIIHGTLSRVREYLYFATFDSYLSISFFSFCIKENFRTHIHTHRYTRVRIPLSSYLILATSTEAKCTLIGNYWTSVFFFEREKKFSRWHLFFYTLFPPPLSLSRDPCFAIFHLSYLSSTNRHYSEIYHRGGGVNRLERDQSWDQENPPFGRHAGTETTGERRDILHGIA